MTVLKAPAQDSVTAPIRDSLVSPRKAKPRDTIGSRRLHIFSGSEEVDLLDIGRNIVVRHAGPRTHNSVKHPGRIYASFLPAIGYTLQTGFALDGVGNLAFYTGTDSDANISNIYLNTVFTEKKQVLIPLQGNIWTKGNKFNILNDWRYEKYPQDTYGLGGHTLPDSGYQIDFSHLRFYQTVLKTISPDFYLGLGYDLDYYWNIVEQNPFPGRKTDFEKYGFQNRSISSGITFNMLYDSRRNSINPEQGYYTNIVYRPNFTFLGSDANWQSLTIDARTYLHFPYGSRNMLAFWTFDVFSLGGNPPYLLLPATGSDTYSNFGRGYIQGRYRGRNVLYLESEYRFGILSNGLLGGVVFANGQSFSEPATNRFEAINPGVGAGIRIKLNKFSRTSIAIDYGFGLHGSQGIFANLGEVF